MERYRELILENIDYDILLERNPYDKDLPDGYVELMLEICCSTRESVRICGQDFPTVAVRSRLLKLNSEHISYIMDYDTIDEQTRSLYRQGISAFDGIAPTYRIALEKDLPVIVWDFHSLLVMVQMCFSFMLTDKDSDMHMCKHCKKTFVASRKGNEFCSQRCKNQFNVYKSREKKKGNESDNR